MILTVTLNAAVDKRYVIEGLKIGEVNRTISTKNSAGGKGINVARVCSLLGERVIATGFVGGYSGQYIEDETKKQGIKSDFCHVDGESRSCINIYDKITAIQTEVLEGGIEVTNKDETAFKELYTKLVDECKIVVISGSVPSGSSLTIYNELVEIAKQKNKKVIVDTSKDYLKRIVEVKPTMIKPNTDEIAQLVGRENLSKAEVIEAAKELHQGGIEIVAVSLGKDGSIVVYENEVYEIIIPPVKTVNSVGCGDSMIAGFATGLNRGLPIEEIIKLASASGTSNALSEETGYIELEQVNELITQVKIIKKS